MYFTFEQYWRQVTSVCERGRLVELHLNQSGRIALVLDKCNVLIAFDFRTGKF